MERLKPYSVPIFLALSVALTFLAIEWKHPWFFLQDDNRFQVLPLYVHAYRALLSGELAHYNFYQLLGTPTLSVMISGVLYPPMYASVFLSNLFFGHFYGTMEFLAIFHLLGATLAFYALARHLGVGRAGAAFGAYGWVFSGMVFSTGDSCIMLPFTAFYLPLLILLSLKMLAAPSWRLFLWWTLTRTLFFFSGHPQYMAFSGAFEMLFLAAMAYPGGIEGVSVASVKRFALLFAAHAALTAALSCPLLLPALRHISENAMRQQPMSWAEFSTYAATFDIWIRGVFTPLAQYIATQDLFNIVYISHFGYLPALFLPVGAYAAWSAPSTLKRATFAFLALGFIALCYAGDYFFVARLAYALPLFNKFRWLFKSIYLVSFSALFVASVGVDWAVGRARAIGGGNKRFAEIAIAALFALHGANFLWFYMQDEQRMQAQNYDPIPLSEPWVEELGEGRVASLGFKFYTENGIRGFTAPSLGFNYATLFEVMQFSGYDTLASKEHAYNSFNTWFDALIPLRAPWSFRPTRDNVMLNHMRMWGVRWYIFDREAPIGDLANAQLVRRDDRRLLVYDRDALPMAYYRRGSMIVPVPYRVGVNNMDFDLDLPEGTTVLLNVLYTPYFKAYVDGVETPVSETGESQTLVSAPAGRHELTLVYVDTRFRLGVAIAAAGAALFAAAWFYARKRQTTPGAGYGPTAAPDEVEKSGGGDRHPDA